LTAPLCAELAGYKIEAIRAPSADNPFGYFIEGTLAVPATFATSMSPRRRVVLMGGNGILAEIGGEWAMSAFSP
jgi:hypothetical protein